MKMCFHCKAELSSFEFARSPFCLLGPCQRARVQYELKQQKIQLQSQQVEVQDKILTLPEFQQSIREKNVDKYKLKSIILPSNYQPLVAQTEVRKKQFLSHISNLYNEIDAGVAEKNFELSNFGEDKELNNIERHQVEIACGTCKGYCCLAGTTHAFQDHRSLSDYVSSLAEKPSVTELLKLYSQYFPNVTSKNGCVFQGDAGCTLPSEMRSKTCNRFYCQPLKKHVEKLSQEHVITVFASHNKTDFVNYSVIKSDEVIILSKKFE